MSNNAPDYKDNLVLEPSMPRCDIEELQNKLAHSEKMRDLQAEYACKLEEKLKIAEEALSYALGFYGYCEMKNYPCVGTKDFEDDKEKIENALKQIRG